MGQAAANIANKTPRTFPNFNTVPDFLLDGFQRVAGKGRATHVPDQDFVRIVPHQSFQVHGIFEIQSLGPGCENIIHKLRAIAIAGEDDGDSLIEQRLKNVPVMRKDVLPIPGRGKTPSAPAPVTRLA